jgi:hypothetical protein
MANAMLLGRGDGSAEKVWLIVKETAPRVVSDNNAAYWKEHLCVVFSLKVSPQFVRA